MNSGEARRHKSRSKVTQVVVIGGGVSGLASAYFLSEKINPAEITIIEAEDRFGGTIRGVDFGSRRVETGPDSFITRNPSAVEMASELKLSDRLVSPATSSAFIYSRSRLHRIPAGTVFGAPSDFKKFFGNSLISRAGQLRASLELLMRKATVEGDTTVGSFAQKRWGKEVTERLIDPLVGGIHAGSVHQLSLAQCAPQYLKAAESNRSVSIGLKSQTANYTSSGHPAFYSFASGLSELVNALVELLTKRNVKMIADTKAIEILPGAAGYSVVTDSRTFEAEGVICATPAYITAGLVKPFSSSAAALLSTVEYASPIMTLLAYEDEAFSEPPEGSGILVPRPNKTLATAITFATNKWPTWKTDGETLLRISTGRVGDNKAWEFDDELLVAGLEAEMKDVLGVRARSVRQNVTRWDRRIPQFKPFHSQLVHRIREELPPGVELAGAPFLGVGIPACISSGSLAAERLTKGRIKPC